MKSIKPVRVMAVTSGKGGVGKTTVSVNMAVALAKMGRRVALLDADMGLANVDILLGIYPKYNLAHVLSGEKSLREVMAEGPYGLKVIPGASGIQRMAELSAMEQAALIRAFSEIDQEMDIMIVDTAAGISASVINFVRACQETAVVVCDEPTSLTDAYAFIKLLNRDYSVSRFNVIANMVHSGEQGAKLFQKLCKVTDNYLDVNLQFAGAIPYDLSVRKSVQQQSPVVLEYPDSEISLAVNAVAKKIDALPQKDQAGGYLEFFIERMVQYGAQEDYV